MQLPCGRNYDGRNCNGRNCGRNCRVVAVVVVSSTNLAIPLYFISERIPQLEFEDCFKVSISVNYSCMLVVS